jgi:type IV secretion system protein VirD4
MQLPATDEIVLVSGLPPIRGSKLRYFEDRNFSGRVLPPPVLLAGGYADRPEVREDDWTGLMASPLSPVLAGAGPDACSGGLQQERAPALPARRRVKRSAPEQLDLLGLGDDDAAQTVDAAALDPLRPVIAAHAVNEGSGRGSDLMPSF